MKQCKKRNVYLLIILGSLLMSGYNSVGQTTFSDFKTFADYVTSKSKTLQSGTIKVDQAKRAKLAALLGVLDPSGSASLTYTNNLRLPVYLFPAETFGGQPGTFQEIRSGTRYNTNGNLYAELKLLNLSGWANLDRANKNIRQVDAEVSLSRKQLYEDIADVYYNIIDLQLQASATQENVAAADTLYRVSQRKYALGLISQQDIQQAEVHYLDTKESFEQINYSIQQQYFALKILCDIPDTDSITISSTAEIDAVAFGQRDVLEDKLSLSQYQYKSETALSTYKKDRYAFLPTVSMFLSYTNQQYSNNSRIFDSNVNWIESSYIGFKISIPLPSASSISQASEARYNYMISRNEYEHARIESSYNTKKLVTNYNKAKSQYFNNKRIYELQKSRYDLDLLNYQEGILDINKVVDSFNDMVNARFNFISSGIDVMLSESKINLNNEFND